MYAKLGENGCKKAKLEVYAIDFYMLGQSRSVARKEANPIGSSVRSRRNDVKNTVGGIRMNADINTITNLGDWWDIEDIKRDLYNHVTLRSINNEYKELLYEIILTFKHNNSVTKYFFKKKELCVPCVNQTCECSCLVNGRERRLRIIDPSSHNNLEEFDSGTIEEYAYNDSEGYIKFLKQDTPAEKFNTKLVWVWCQNRVMMGKFGDGARMIGVDNSLQLLTTPSPIQKVIERQVQEGNKT